MRRRRLIYQSTKSKRALGREKKIKGKSNDLKAISSGGTASINGGAKERKIQDSTTPPGRKSKRVKGKGRNGK